MPTLSEQLMQWQQHPSRWLRINTYYPSVFSNSMWASPSSCICPSLYAHLSCCRTYAVHKYIHTPRSWVWPLNLSVLVFLSFIFDSYCIYVTCYCLCSFVHSHAEVNTFSCAGCQQEAHFFVLTFVTMCVLNNLNHMSHFIPLCERVPGGSHDVWQ